LAEGDASFLGDQRGILEGDRTTCDGEEGLLVGCGGEIFASALLLSTLSLCLSKVGEEMAWLAGCSAAVLALNGGEVESGECGAEPPPEDAGATDFDGAALAVITAGESPAS
jgi:hypothetical protein